MREMNIDFGALLKEDKDFAIYCSEVMQLLTGGDTEDWIKRLFEAYHSNVMPEEIVRQVKSL